MSNATVKNTDTTTAKATTATVPVAIDVATVLGAAVHAVSASENGITTLANLPKVIADNKVYAARAIAQLFDGKVQPFTNKGGKPSAAATARELAPMLEGVSKKTIAEFYAVGALEILAKGNPYEGGEPTTAEHKLANVAWAAESARKTQEAKDKRAEAKAAETSGTPDDTESDGSGKDDRDSTGEAVSAQQDYIEKLTAAVKSKVALAKIEAGLSEEQEEQVAELIAALNA